MIDFISPSLASLLLCYHPLSSLLCCRFSSSLCCRLRRSVVDVAVARRHVCGHRSSVVVVVFIDPSPSLVVMFVAFVAALLWWSSSLCRVACHLVCHLHRSVVARRRRSIVFVATQPSQHCFRRYTAVACHLVRRSLSSSLVAALSLSLSLSLSLLLSLFAMSSSHCHCCTVIVALSSLLVVLFVTRCHRRSSQHRRCCRRYVVVAVVKTTTTLDLKPVFKRLLEWCDSVTPGKHLVSGSNDSFDSKDRNFSSRSCL